MDFLQYVQHGLIQSFFSCQTGLSAKEGPVFCTLTKAVCQKLNIIK